MEILSLFSQLTISIKMKRLYLLCLSLLMTFSLKAQDLILSYQEVSNPTGGTTLELYMTNMTAQLMEVGSVNLSFTFQNNCANVGTVWSLFEDEWGGLLQFSQPIPFAAQYNGIPFDRRYQYGNTSLSLETVDLPANAAQTELVMTFDISHNCNLNLFVEDLLNNPANEISDETGSAISYVVQPYSSSLPVEWLDFQAYQTGPEQVSLQWITGEEHQNSHFEIERSQDGLIFSKIGKVNASANPQEFNRYTYDDKKLPAPYLYYRIKQVDLDGKSSYSDVREVQIDREFAWQFEVYPNPATDFLKIVSTSGVMENYRLSLYDLTGRALEEKEVQLGEGHVYELRVDSQPTGIYSLELIRLEDGSRISHQFIKR
jgi:hypothetical protein